MRAIWIVGQNATAKLQLQRVLTQERMGVEYSVRLAASISDIPSSHLNNPGVVALVDAFHPSYPGFEGLKALRALNFTGPIYIFGEPSPDQAVNSFKTQGLTGYLPAMDRADFEFVGGILHYQLNFDGDLELGRFLKPSGRASTEVIKTFRDFNTFGAKLAGFVNRFGIDLAQLKKILMGLSLGHIKTGSGAPLIDQPFTIHYGMDPNKVLLAVSSFSRGASKDALLGEFCEVLSGLRNQKGLPGTIFPELFHVGRAAENLVLFTGSAKSTSDSMDPMMMLASIAFPNVREKKQAPICVFSFAHVRKTLEITPENDVEQTSQAGQGTISASGAPEAQVSHPKLVGSHDASGEAGEKLTFKGDPSASAHEGISAQPLGERDGSAPGGISVNAGQTPASAPPSGMIQDVDINDILEEPDLVGDSPLSGKDIGSAAAKAAAASAYGSAEDGGSVTLESTVVSQENYQKLLEAQKELTHLREVSAAMSADIRRLMKERRQPTTDRELRDAVTQLEEKMKKLSQEKLRMAEQLKERDQLVENLKGQIEALRRTKAA